MEEGSVVSWPLPLGAPVAKGQVVLVIESEKSEAEIESAAAGFLRHIYIEAGAEAVPCGALLAAITETADEEFDAEAFSAAYAAAQPPSAAKPAPATPTAPSAAPARNASTSAARRPVAPAARALARKLGIDVKQVAGSGPGGRVTRGDVSAHAEARERLVPVAESVALEVLREGAGPCVLLLPGFGSDVSSFAPQTRRVSRPGSLAIRCWAMPRSWRALCADWPRALRGLHPIFWRAAPRDSPPGPGAAAEI